MPQTSPEQSVLAPPILRSIRAATVGAHERLEQTLNLLRPGFSKRDYLQTLEDFYGYWAPWENAVQAALDGELAGFFASRRRSVALLSDLLQLGIDPDSVGRLPRATGLPPLESSAAALGSMYVIEGSTLGGQLLFRHFTGKLGIRDCECTFFAGYGPQTGAMWKDFTAELAKRPEDEHTAIIEAAQNTFESLRNWFCRKR